MNHCPRPSRLALHGLALGVLLFASGCASSSFSDQRSAVVVFVNNPTIPADVSPETLPLKNELKSLLKAHDLRLSTDSKRAQWVAYVDATFPARSEDPLSLRLVTVNFNPDRERVARLSTEALPIPRANHPSLRLAEQAERMAQSTPSSLP